MNIFSSFFLSGGLFDFDFTFFAEAILFGLFSLVVTFVFLSPISKQIRYRTSSIQKYRNRSAQNVRFGNKLIGRFSSLLKKSFKELTRESKIRQTLLTDEFDNEILAIKKENQKLSFQLKQELQFQSLSIFSILAKEFPTFVEAFHERKFQ
jgi:hypothetical protein